MCHWQIGKWYETVKNGEIQVTTRSIVITIVILRGIVMPQDRQVRQSYRGTTKFAQHYIIVRTVHRLPLRLCQ